MSRRRAARWLLSALLVAAPGPFASGQDAPPAPAAPAPPGTAPAAAPEAAATSPWYLERGTAPRAAAPDDDVPAVAAELVKLMKDGGVPGFYDGQFQSVAGRFDELAAIASDPDMHHILRVMAVMALQEAGRGEALAAVLNPLLIPAEKEFDLEQSTAWQDTADDPKRVRQALEADLSLHARFSLAKAGQIGAVNEKIHVMQQRINRAMFKLLDGSLSSERDPNLRIGRDVIFMIGYHYQQFDDYEHASEWFHKLCDNLPGSSDTTWAHYNLACIAALTGHPDDAIEHLRQAYEVGFTDSSWMSQDGDLKSLRDRPDFKALLSSMRNEPEARPGRPPGTGALRERRPPAAAQPAPRDAPGMAEPPR